MMFISLFLLTLLLINPQTLRSQNCTVNANVDLTICAHDPLILIGQKAGLGAVTTTWSQISGPSVLINAPHSLTSTVSGYTGGNTYKFRLSTTCLDGTLIYDDVTYIVKPASNANAGTSFYLAPGNSLGPLQANTPNYGVSEVGLWSIIGTNNGVTINNPSSPTSTINVSGNACGNTILQWGITNPNGCGTFDTLIITNCGGVSPVSAGSNQTLSNCFSTTQSTSMNASYGGCGVNGQIGTWLVLNGPNIPTIANSHSNTTSISNLIQGTYSLRWVVSGPCVNGTSDVQIIVPAPTSSVTSASVISGSQTYCDGRTSTVLKGNLQLYTNESVTWEQTGGPLGATIVSPTNRITNVTSLDGSSTYTFKYTISNSATGCSSSSNVTIGYATNPSISLTTSQMMLSCGSTSATVNYNATGSGSVEWSIVSGPSGCTYAIPTVYKTAEGGSPYTINGLTEAGTYVIRFRKSPGIGSSCEAAFADLVVIVSADPTASNSGTSQTLVCNVTSTALAGNDPYVGIGKWTQVSGPNTAIIDSIYRHNSPISGLTNGLYTFRWVISGGPACPTKQTDVNVLVAASNPTTANAGPDQFICASTALYLDANKAASNETGTWSVVPSSGVTFSDIHSANAIVNGLTSNTNYTFTWTISNSCNSSSDDCAVHSNGTTGPIQSLAGADQCLPSGTTSITLNGNNPSPGTGLWTKLTGGSATITNNVLRNTTVTGLSDGTYTFEWAISYGGGCAPSRDTVMITISNTATTANAGVDQNICGNSATLAGNNPTIGTGYWSQVIGDGGVTITAPNTYNTTVSNLGSGVYAFVWTISNDACSSSNDTVILNVTNQPTTAYAGIDFTVCGASSTPLNGNTITSGVGYWLFISGPNTPDIADITSPTTSISNIITGTYVYRWTSSTGYYCPLSSDDVSITVVRNADAGADQSYCETTTYTSLIGTINSTGTWSQISGPNSSTIDPITSNNAVASGLIPGSSYTFRYTVSSFGCNSTDDMTVTLYPVPTTANAGSDQSVCNQSSFSLSGNTPLSGNGIWSKLDGPSGGSYSPDNTSPSTSFTGGSSGTYVFVWTIANGTCSSSDQVRIENSSLPTPAYAGADQNIVCATQVTMTANTPAIGLGNWTFVSGPNTPTITSPILPNSTITGVIPGLYKFDWTISNGSCASSTDQVEFTIEPTPTTADAGSDQVLCDIHSTSMNGGTLVSGTGLWTQVSGPSTATFTDNTNPTTSVSGLTNYGVYVFDWTTTLGSCTSSDQMTVTIYQNPTVADASATTTDVCLFSDIYLTGNTPAVGTGTWTQVSGPTTAYILDPSSPTSAIIGVTTGTYQFTWTISNGTCTPSSNNVTITIHDIPTMALAGANQTLCNVTSTFLAANTATTGTGTWTKVSGPSVTFVDANNPTTEITGLTAGTYILQWEIANASCTSSDQMQLIIYDLPTTALAGSDQEYCNSTTFNMAGNIATSGQGTWTKVSGPSSYSITNSHLETTTITGVTTGTYTFRWTIDNGNCTPSYDEVTIHNYVQPNTANAGSDKIVCGTSTTMSGNTATSGTTGTWTLQAGPNTPSFSNIHSKNNNVTGLIPGTYTLRWTIASGTCTSTYDDVDLNVYDIPTTASAGSTQNLCLSTPSTSTILNGNTAIIGNGLWSQVTGPNTATFDDQLLPNATISNLIAGTYTFKWTITNGGCSSNSTVTINVYQVPTDAIAGSDQTICLSSSLSLNGNIPSVGTGLWSRVSGPNTPTIVSASSPTSSITGFTSGVYVYRWTITNGTCTSTDDVSITIDALATVANAGTDQDICNSTTGTLAGNTASVGTGTWTKLSGPSATISNINSHNSGLTGLSAGVYSFQWQIVNGTCSSSDNTTINVYDLPTTANAGSDQSYCNATTFNMLANVPSVGTGTWIKISGPSSYTITSPHLANTTITGVVTGTYVFRWTIDNGNCTPSYDEITITNYIQPNTSNAGVDQNVCGTSTTMAANLATSGTTGTWSQVSGPNIASISNLNLNTASATGLIQGTYTLRWTISNGTCTPSSDIVVLNVYNIPTTANAGVNQSLCSEYTTTTLHANTPVIGTGQWSQISGPNTAVFANINSPSSGLSSLVFGQYIFRWTIANGPCSNYSDVYVDLVKCVDLRVTKVLSDPDPILHPHHHIHKLDTVTFTITLTNNSTNTATNNIQVLDTLPSVFHYVSSTTSAGTYTSATGIWDINTLAALNTATLTIRARVDTSAQNNVYIISHSYPDLDSSNNKSFASVTARHSSSGHDGGLESNGSLVSKVALRNFKRQKEGEICYENTKDLQTFVDFQAAKSLLSTNTSDLSSFIPAAGTGSMGYNTTPLDLVGVTNAMEVIAVDYFTDSTDRQGSILGIATTPATVYGHTKMVCDRLNGARLVSVNDYIINNHHFFMSRLEQSNGDVDYTVNFIAYKNGNQYNIDNQWDLDTYTPTGNSPVLNFQVWSINEKYTEALVKGIFDKMTSQGYSLNLLNTKAPVQPAVYAVSGTYDNGAIALQLNNTVNANAVQFTGTTAAVENGIRTNYSQNSSISNTFNSSAVVNTGTIFDIGFKMSNNMQTGNDVLYFADGPWGVDIDSAGATVNNFSISALNNISYANCYNLLRNANVDGKVKTYASLFRALKAANNTSNISNYKYIEFNASGSGTFEMTLSKKSISNWSNQYKTSINLTSTQNHYKITLSDLYNASGQTSFNGNDVMAVVFTKNGNYSTLQDFNIKVSNLHFSGNTAGINETNSDSKDIKLNVYPNPASKQTLISFNMPEASKLKISLYNEQGNLVSVIANEHYNSGDYTINYNVANLDNGIYFMKFETDKFMLNSKMIVIH